MQTDQLVYDNEIVGKHDLYSCCKSTLNDVSKKDYPNKNYFDPRIECLDMDYYEKNVRRPSNPEETVDAVMGIKKIINNKLGKPCLLPVEFRMDYKSSKNFSRDKLLNKDRHTRDLLGSMLPVFGKTLCVFDKSIEAQVRNWFENQKLSGGFSSFAYILVQNFKETIVSIDDIPFVPQYKEEEIIGNIESFIKSEDISGLIKQMDFWCKKTICEHTEYSNPKEHYHLKSVLKKIWNNFDREKYSSLGDETVMEIEILEEDYPFLKSN